MATPKTGNPRGRPKGRGERLKLVVPHELMAALRAAAMRADMPVATLATQLVADGLGRPISRAASTDSGQRQA